MVKYIEAMDSFVVDGGALQYVSSMRNLEKTPQSKKA